MCCISYHCDVPHQEVNQCHRPESEVKPQVLVSHKTCFVAQACLQLAKHNSQPIRVSTASFGVRPHRKSKLIPKELQIISPLDNLNYTPTLFIMLSCCSRLKKSVHGGCYSKVGLPLIEYSSIVEQPLDLWTLTEQYKSAATGIIQNARYNTAAQVNKV